MDFMNRKEKGKMIKKLLWKVFDGAEQNVIEYYDL